MFVSHVNKLIYHNITTDTMVMMATDLGLSGVEVEDIHEIWPAKRRLEMFKKWQGKKISEATYRYVCVCIVFTVSSGCIVVWYVFVHVGGRGGILLEGNLFCTIFMSQCRIVT